MLTPEAFSAWVSASLKAKAKPFLGTEVRAEQIWFAAPDGAPVEILYTLLGDRNALAGQILGPDFTRTGAKPIEGKIWIKIAVRLDEGRLRATVSLRPGLVLGRTLDHQRAVLVPGTSAPGKPGQFAGMPRLEITYPESVDKDHGFYDFWNPASVESEPGIALINPLTDLEACGKAARKDYSWAVNSLMAEVLGLREPNWGPASLEERDALRARARYKRGEVVRVNFHSEKPSLCVVVSDNLLNGRSQHSLVVLVTVDYEPGDEADDRFVPIELEGGACRRSVSLLSLQGVTNATRTVSTLTRRVFLQNMPARDEGPAWTASGRSGARPRPEPATVSERSLQTVLDVLDSKLERYYGVL